MTRALLRVDAGDVGAVLSALRAALSEHGPAVLPVAAGSAANSGAAGQLPIPGAAGPGANSGAATVGHDIALVIQTSGSSGQAKRVALTADALLASAAASAAALGGEGQWLLTLPAHYIAGAQILVRSLCAGTEPVLLPTGHFDPIAFAAATLSMTGEQRFVSLVPVQLARLLDAADEHQPGGNEVREALDGFDRILVGGQALPTALRERAEAAGLRLVRSYGSSETAGGCIYDGVPIGSTRARAVGGMLELSGPSLASGYLGDPARTEAAFHEDGGARWYRTGDLGEVGPDGRVTVLGRADNVIISGGEKVSLDAIERLVHGLASYPELADALVVSAPSAEWGQTPVLVVPGATQPSDAALLAAVRAAVAPTLGVAARPARLLRVTETPRLASGKPDRQALSAAAGS